MSVHLEATPLLPTLGPNTELNVELVRDGKEKLWGGLVWLFCGIIVLLAIAAFIGFVQYIIPALLIVGTIMLFSWMEWNLALAMIRGHSIRVSAQQYPTIYQAVTLASTVLFVNIPEIYIIQGDGMFDLFIAKRYTRRGIIILTSNMVDAFAKEPSSREFMMLVGRQLGHIKCGHFRYWWIRDTIGPFSFLIYLAWKRRCHATADRIGLLVAGDLGSAQRALSRLTVGEELSPTTNFAEVENQREFLFARTWSWIALGLSAYPFMVDRICRLGEFALNLRPDRGVAALPIVYPRLRPTALLLIHGHDELALLEVKDFLRENYPDLVVLVMKSELLGTLSMSEKFEAMVRDADGAIAIMTPDDHAYNERQGVSLLMRPRQNVIVEIGWVWARLGREKVLLLGRGILDIPSDLSGVEVVQFQNRPSERFEDIRKFLRHFPAMRVNGEFNWAADQTVAFSPELVVNR